MFKVGDKVVYPHHGAAVVERRETKVAFGEKREYLVLRLAYGDLTLMVPADNTEGVGLREVINDEEVEEVFAVLRKKEARMPTNWSRRYKNHSEKLRSGDIYQVAEVVRNLSIRDKDKGLSAGEKRMLSRARQILVSELTFALAVDEETAEQRLNDALPESGARGAGRARAVAVGRTTVWAVVVAAGSGDRFGRPKQFALLAGRPVVEWSVAACRAAVAGVVLVLPDGRLDRDLRGRPWWWPAGATRRPRCAAAWPPFPPTPTWWSCTTPPARWPAAALFAAVVGRAGRSAGGRGRSARCRSRDTVKRVAPDRRDRSSTTLDRAGLVAVQTPQAFRADGPAAGPRRPAARPPTTPRWWRPSALRCAVVPGDPRNVKLTTPADLAYAEHLLGRVTRAHRPGVRRPRLRRRPDRPLVLGGVDGARGAGAWTGTATPTRWPTRWPTPCSARPGSATWAATSPTPIPRWAGADSIGLLAEVAVTVAQAGLPVVNADCTVVAEAPAAGALHGRRWRRASGRRSVPRSR